MRNVLFLVLLLGVLIACVKLSPDAFVEQPLAENEHEVSKDVKNVGDALHFFVIGDWGRNGEEHQRDVAIMMSKTAKVIEPEFIISTGDNLYPNGVASTRDPLWHSSFEDIYKEHNLHCQWNVVLGNHDYRGNVQAEIDYTKVSRRWNMPSRYFVINKTLDDGTKIDFVYVDTSPFEDEYYSEDVYKQNVSTQDTTLQKKWIDKQLSESVADWKVVVGHHPMYTGGKRKDELNTVRRHLESTFTKNKVDAYFAGHEHDLQHMKLDETPTHHFISGCGSEARPTGEIPSTKFSKSIQGFMIVSVSKREMLVQVVDYMGNLIYSTTIVKP